MILLELFYMVLTYGLLGLFAWLIFALEPLLLAIVSVPGNLLWLLTHTMQERRQRRGRLAKDLRPSRKPAYRAPAKTNLAA